MKSYQDESVLNRNIYAEKSIDSKIGYGPETIAINRWADINSSKGRIGGHYEYYVHWFND